MTPNSRAIPPPLSTASHKGTHYLWNSAIAPNVEPLFQDRGFTLNHTSGRGCILFFEAQGIPLVWRHYQRGGLVRHVIKDHYLFRDLSHTRMWREFLLLHQLFKEGFPVPKPIAARCQNTPFFLYQGDLITQLIPQSKTLAQTLMDAPLNENNWFKLGHVIAHFHNRGVFHADLNAHNILLDDQLRFYLIDFDRGEIRTSRHLWPQANNQRLLRSLHKIASQNQSFFFTQNDWHHFNTGYAQTFCP